MTPILISRGLDAIYYTQIHRLFDWLLSGVGVIFCFHRVTERSNTSAFAPNADLEIEAGFLRELLRMARREDRDIITLDEVRQRLLEQRFTRRFVCFTVDDVYEDTYQLAFPLFRQYDAPFTVFITTGIPDRSFPIWWCGLEQILHSCDTLRLPGEQGPERMDIASAAAKQAAFDRLVRMMKSSASAGEAFTELCQLNGLPIPALAEDVGVTWEALRSMHDSGLVEIGAHTLTHPSIADLAPLDAEREMAQSRRIIEERLGCRVRHFAFPYGHAAACGPRDFSMAERLGYDTAVTTRRRVLMPADAQRLHALPRFVLNGHFQKSRYAKVFMSGVVGPIETAMSWLRQSNRSGDSVSMKS
jgi:peptidoglycan/xylan/chitin deacetylase (PgdA/CDA1 family)